ncbi:DNA repair protein RecO [Prochlorococcus sp. MIT 0916]|uniref:DNA repair protein RecO n=1 Tax=Prochlorococcus sp. MIT 0916 TaxID=3082521 RepID=UPI0039B5DF3E
MSPNQRVKGLSLKVGPLGENDRLLTLLTEENGISRLAIPGARKPRSRLGATSPFNFLDLHIVGNKDLKRVTQIKILKSYGNLGKHIETLSAAQAISELIIIMVGNENPQKDLLKLVLIHLNRLDDLHKIKFDSLQALAISVQSCIHLLALGGYCLPLQNCCHSGSKLIAPIGEWSWKCSFIPEEGFAIGGIPNASIELNPSELALLQRLLLEKLPCHSNGKLLGPKYVWLKLLKVVEAWIATHLQKRITSLQMMREVIISSDLNTK